MAWWRRRKKAIKPKHRDGGEERAKCWRGEEGPAAGREGFFLSCTLQAVIERIYAEE